MTKSKGAKKAPRESTDISYPDEPKFVTVGWFKWIVGGVVLALISAGGFLFTEAVKKSEGIESRLSAGIGEVDKRISGVESVLRSEIKDLRDLVHQLLLQQAKGKQAGLSLQLSPSQVAELIQNQGDAGIKVYRPDGTEVDLNQRLPADSKPMDVLIKTGGGMR